MNIFSVAKHAVTVLYQGRSFTNVAGLKNVQALTNLGISLAALVALFVPGFDIPEDVIVKTATAIAGFANWYLVLSTSKTMGIPNVNLPPIELQASSELCKPTLRRKECDVSDKNTVKRQSDTVSTSVIASDAHWMRDSEVPSDTETATDSTEDNFGGFTDQ